MKKLLKSMVLVAVLAVTGGLLFNNINIAKAETDVSLNIQPVIAMSLANCDNPSENESLNLNVMPSSSGVFTNNCQNLTVATNAPGYQLSVKAESNDDTNNLVYQNPLPPNLITPPYIAATANSLSSPNILANNTWGFAVTSNNVILDTPIDNFDASYTIGDSSGIYAGLPNSETTIHDTDELPGQIDNFTFYYGVRVTAEKLAGTYQTTVTYTATSADIPEPPEPLCTIQTCSFEPSPEWQAKDTLIVPNFASTQPPTGNGTGTNGPQFSIFGSGFGSSPTVTIGGQPCTDITVNSTETAITCTGPVSGLTDGEQRTFINGVDAGDASTVWYSTYNFLTLQSLTTTGTCDGTATDPIIYRDARDSQLYYVAKLADNKCWMLDNLRYKPNGDTTGTVTSGFIATQQADTGTILSQDGTMNATDTPNNYDIALYIDPIPTTYCYGNTNISPENITKCGLLYNFYTATAGTAPQFQTTGDASGSICPTNWHLPTDRNASGDFAVLDLAAGGTGTYSIPPTTAQLALWWPNGSWRGVFSGTYGFGFSAQGTTGLYWSSSIVPDFILRLEFSNSRIIFGVDSAGVLRFVGHAMRCVL